MTLSHRLLNTQSENVMTSVGNSGRADFGTLNNASNIVLTFTGLDDSLSYDVTGGGNFTNNNFDTVWTFGATTATTNNGVAPFVTLAGLSTDGSGNLSVIVTRGANQLLFSAVSLTAIPEPSSSLLMGLGLLAGFARRR
ncbi:MAG: PEP-CTERM sorting domain-containing protein [Akkermansiaceae bacterium]